MAESNSSGVSEQINLQSFSSADRDPQDLGVGAKSA